MSNKSLNKKPQDTTVLVPGGAGYIGSHTCVELLEQGYKVVVLDDLSNSSEVALDRVREITGCSSDQLVFYRASILDAPACETVFKEHDIDVIIMFAGFKAVGESTRKPLEYYWNNVGGAITLFNIARNHGCKNVIFSSSATVYGEDAPVPYTEETPRGKTTNPYGETKSMIERILEDLYASDNEWNTVILRYFNPIGAHESGKIGEDPEGIPNNLLPYVAQVAVGKLKRVGVFGNDYPTPDGTGVRDYIHVVDLARGHVQAIKWMAGEIGSNVENERAKCSSEEYANGNEVNDCSNLNNANKCSTSADTTRHGVEVFNLGTGRGSSVMDVIHAFSKACGHEIPYEIQERRPGDLAKYYAKCDKARTELEWVAEYDLARMCEDSWRWQSNNPNGYRA